MAEAVKRAMKKMGGITLESLSVTRDKMRIALAEGPKIPFTKGFTAKLKATFGKLKKSFWYQAYSQPVPPMWAKEFFILLHDYNIKEFTDETTAFLYDLSWMMFGASAPKDAAARINLLDAIYTKYIEVTGDKAVNIGYPTQARISALYNQVGDAHWMEDGKLVYPQAGNKNVWWSAQREIKRLIETDILPRLLKKIEDSLKPGASAREKDECRPFIRFLREYKPVIEKWKPPTLEQICAWSEDSDPDCPDAAHSGYYNGQSHPYIDYSHPYIDYSHPYIDYSHPSSLNVDHYWTGLVVGGVFGGAAIVFILVVFCIGLAFGMVTCWAYMQQRALEKGNDKEVYWKANEDENESNL